MEVIRGTRERHCSIATAVTDAATINAHRSRTVPPESRMGNMMALETAASSNGSRAVAPPAGRCRVDGFKVRDMMSRVAP